MAEATGGAQDQLAVRAQDQLAVRGMRPAQGMTQEDVERMKRQIMSGTDGLPDEGLQSEFCFGAQKAEHEC